MSSDCASLWKKKKLYPDFSGGVPTFCCVNSNTYMTFWLFPSSFSPVIPQPSLPPQPPSSFPHSIIIYPKNSFFSVFRTNFHIPPSHFRDQQRRLCPAGAVAGPVWQEIATPVVLSSPRGNSRPPQAAEDNSPHTPVGDQSASPPGAFSAFRAASAPHTGSRGVHATRAASSRVLSVHVTAGPEDVAWRE